MEWAIVAETMGQTCYRKGFGYVAAMDLLYTRTSPLLGARCLRFIGHYLCGCQL